MATKLSDITTNYRRFTQNQVLTEGQLNEIVNYFDDQDRLSRILLSGVGLLCGFEVSFSEEASNIYISQGTAITTDGDIIKFFNEEGNKNVIQQNHNTYSFFKKYDNKDAKYKPYFYDNDDQLEIYELFTLKEVNSSKVLQEETKQLEFLLGDEIGDDSSDIQKVPLHDAVVLLYLEEYDKKKDLCVSLSCDNQGLEVSNRLKVLLVRSSVAQRIMQYDTISKKPNLSTSVLKGLPDLMANRVLMQPEYFSDYEELKKEFSKGVFRNEIVGRTLKAYQQLFYGLNLPSWYNVFEERYQFLFQFGQDENIPPDFQYRYDVLKDIIDTYNELKQELHCMEYYLSCTPDINAFPKHILLGGIQEEKTGVFRYNFYKSPIFKQCKKTLKDFKSPKFVEDELNREQVFDIDTTLKLLYQSQNLQQIKLYSLLKRSLQQLLNYNSNFTNIRITPSYELGELSKKAIPFYNNVGQHLINLWDIEKTIIEEQGKNRSYHTQLLNEKRPLEVTFDTDFYRIEGHQGKNYKEVVTELEAIRAKYNLSFNIVALKVKGTREQSKDFLHEYTEQYLKRNHGYEHKAGVVPGGTFILIYIDSEYDEYPYPYGYGYPYYYPKALTLSGDFDGNEVEKPIEVLTPVVADFSIPYLCCDENLIGLSLPVKELCFDDNTLPIPFTVMPKKGYVEAEVEEGLNGGVVYTNQGEFVFDPKLVSHELHGKPIKFTANNFETDCAILVNRRPEFSFMVDTISEPTSDREIKVVFRIIANNDQEDVDYTWNFGDGSDSLTTSDMLVSYTYKLEENIARFKVSLFGKKDRCSNEFSEDILLEIPEVELSLPEDHICFDDNTFPLPFNVEPRGGVVDAITDNGLNGGVVRLDGNYFFDPKLVSSDLHGEPISFTVNGFDTDCIVSVSPKPNFQFMVETLGEPIEETVLVTFLITQNPPIVGTEFTWDFGDGTPTETTPEFRVSHRYTASRGRISPLVTVTATAGSCRSEFSDTILIELPRNTTVSIEPQEFCRTRNEVFPFTILPPNAIVELDGEGVVSIEGRWGFNPSLTTSSSVTISIDGIPSNLIISISDLPIPRFDLTIEGDNLVIVNNSDNADTYLWDINGQKVEKNTRHRMTIPLSEIPNSEEEIVVSLQTVTEICGVSEKLEKTIKRDKCLAEINNYIDEKGSEYESLTSTLQGKLESSIDSLWSGFLLTLTDVRDLRDIVDLDPNEPLNFVHLFGGIDENIFQRLIRVIERIETEEDKLALSFLGKAYVRLFYLLWCCASKRGDVNFENIIVLEQGLQDFLGATLQNGFDIDRVNTLKPFLITVKEECSEQTLITNSIDKTLTSLDFGDR
ncbi:PKD repeat-containing protein [Tenacibaculum sp. MAR_2009_124]|uniref:PKD domain-containing protein n=1 Tax=Tenacibaculum sp. MAR_2009_124 TaxID=1250059 RepID=UPI000898002F|nr:PKD domain-containing protein [Tenacibaculum sp. MAR_2009_124]SEC21237.1 PKD repeat-containing protein [Tenacibaculum sp. MAR_2009_124]